VDNKQNEVCKILKILMWVWFGTITSFVAMNVLNNVKLETKVNNFQHSVNDLKKDYLMFKFHTILK
jgi:hypothetical protein